MNIFKWLKEKLFDNKSLRHPECQKVFSELEKIKNSYVSDEEFRSLNIEQQRFVLEKEQGDAKSQMNSLGKVTSGYLRREDDSFPEPGILTTSSTSDKVMNVDVSKNPPKITFFDPEDNKKETILNEKKASEIKKKRQYKKKKK